MGRNGTNKKANKLENCTLKLLTDFVKIYDECLAPSLCDKIINAFEADDEHHIESKIGALNEHLIHQIEKKPRNFVKKKLKNKGRLSSLS